jgi:hypothetical protein
MMKQGGKAGHMIKRLFRAAMLLGIATLLLGVLALSAKSAFAAPSSAQGYRYQFSPIACGWNVVSSPNGSGSSALRAVAKVSATDIWAVGGGQFTGSRTLIEHWDGTSWMR